MLRVTYINSGGEGDLIEQQRDELPTCHLIFDHEVATIEQCHHLKNQLQCLWQKIQM